MLSVNDKIKLLAEVVMDNREDNLDWLCSVFIMENSGFHERAADILTENLFDKKDLANKLVRILPDDLFGQKLSVIIMIYA